jgi:protein SCO1
MKRYKTLCRSLRWLALGPLVWCTAWSEARTHAAGASSLTDAALVQINFEQKLNSPVSLDLVFRDEAGQNVRLGAYFDRQPVILVLGYYGCPMLCTLVLNGLVESLLDLRMDIGKQFQVVNVSIDPTEKPELAAAKKRTYLKRYGRHGAAEGWHFLTGDEPAIKTLAAQTGFHYAYDASLRQYAHPSGIIILTPEGKVARYFFGIDFAPRELDGALKQASAGWIGSPIRQLLLLCFHYSPITGKYGNLVMTAIRVSGIATLVGLGAAMVLASQRRREKRLLTSAAPPKAIGRATNAPGKEASL